MNDNTIPLNFEVILSEDTNDVYVKLSGFTNIYDAESYAAFLVEYLPLMLFESDVLH